MSNVGQAVLSIGGAIVGSFFGSPAAGFAVGSILGQEFFPSRPGVPAIADNVAGGATEGTPLPILYGTVRGAGFLLRSYPIDREQNGGKGGAPSTGYNDYFTGAYGFGTGGLGPAAGLWALWIDNVLVYDVRPGVSDATLAQSASFASKMAIYLGSDTQLPDPTLESKDGVGNMPAFRGLSYIVFNGIDVTTNGPRPPQIEALWVMSGVTGSDSQLTRTSDVLFPWVDNADPRNCLNDHEYSADGTTWHPLMAEAILDLNALHGYTFLPTIIGWSLNAGSNADMVPQDFLNPGEQEILYFHLNPTEFNPARQFDRLTFNTDWEHSLPVSPGDPPFWWSGRYDVASGAADFGPAGIYQLGVSVSIAGDYSPPALPHGNVIGYAGTLPPTYTYFPQLSFSQDRPLLVRRKVRGPDAPCAPRCQTPYPAYPGSPDYCVIGGQPVSRAGYGKVTGAPGTYVWLSDYFADIVSGVLTVVCYPMGPALLATDPNNTKAFWDNQYALARIAFPGGIPSGMTYQAGLSTPDGLHYPVLMSYDWERVVTSSSITPTPITVGEICGSIAAISGLASGDYDFTALNELIVGYQIARISNGRDAIQPLLQYAFADATDTGAQLLGVLRGGASVLTLTDDDLAAVESGNTTPPKVTVTRTQPIELPKLVRVHFTDTTNDWQPGQQLMSREYGPSRAPVDLELAIPMTPTQALQIADIALNEAYAGRERYQVTVPALPDFLLLKPADAIQLPVEGKTALARIITCDYAHPGLITLALARSDEAVYSSSATTTITGNVPATPLAATGPSFLTILDLPALTTSVNDAGVYVSVYGLFGGWRGAGIYESKDGGGTYNLVTMATTGANQGTINAPLPTGSETVIDHTTTLSVDLINGSLSSVADSALATSSVNLFAVGAQGRWLLIQASSCVLQMDGSWLLSGFLQGLHGTAANRGTSVTGDTIVLLDSAIRRAPENASDIGQTRLLRAVTYGTSLADAQDVEFTIDGVSYTPMLAGSPPAGSIVVGAPSGSAPGSQTSYVAPSVAGQILIDQGPGVAPAFVPVSGDGTIDHTGALVVTKTSGVAFTSAATTALDTDGALTADSDSRIATQKAVRTAINAAVTGLWNDCGNYDASGNAYPSSGGSGTAGAIQKGDIWTISVAGTLGSTAVALGDTVRALVDSPGSTSTNWALGEHDLGFTPLRPSNNLSDVSNVAAAQSNLGLGSLALQSNTLTVALNYAAPVTLPSAATVNIGAAASNVVTISGTTTITAFDTIAAGTKREITFSGALTLTHNATSLILPGAANITTAAGDVASFLSLGSGNWRCMAYTRSSGLALVGGNATLNIQRGANWDNGALPIVATDAKVVYRYMPVACTITGWTILGDGNTGSCQIDVWKAAYSASSLPAVANSITASAKPTLSTNKNAQSATLTGWTLSVSAGDVLAFNLVSASALTAITFDLILSVP